MSKAFDTISHDIPIHKLEHYDIRGICIVWFASYPTNRSQYAKININTGDQFKFVLNIYKDTNNGSNLNIPCIADGTTANNSGPNIIDLISDVDTQLQLLYTWLSCNKLSFNINKTSYTIFRPHSNTHINISNSLHINHGTIKSSEETTKAGAAHFLGVYIDQYLTYSQHIDHVCTSLTKSIFAINMVKYLLPQLTGHYISA